jgi:hypothetical protein
MAEEQGGQTSSSKDRPAGLAQASPAANPQDIVNAFGNLLQTSEVQVLGAMGLLIGYICVFYAKILGFQNIYAGVAGISIITFLLIALTKDFNWFNPVSWIRAFVVIILCLLITAPQLYNAWTVSVSELQSQKELQHQAEVRNATDAKVPPSIKIEN